MQDTPLKPSPVPGLGLKAAVQMLPFQKLGQVLTLPRVILEHADRSTATRSAARDTVQYAARAALGLATTAQVRPFHDSTSVLLVVGVLSAAPTATQWVGAVHDTPASSSFGLT